MDLNKKEIIFELAKGVHSNVSAQAYGFIRRKLIEKQGISEVALYSAVAEHLQENDIDPSRYTTDMIQLLKDISENLFAIKTNDNYSYLRSSFSAINLEGSPESKGQFLCNKCFIVKDGKDRCPKENYKNSCDNCYKEESKKSATRYQQRQRDKKKEEKNSPPPEPTEPTEEVKAPEAAQQPQSPPQQSIEHMDPYIEIDSLTGDASSTIVSVSCDTISLSKLLLLLDPYIITPKKPEPKPTPESEPKSEPQPELENEQ